VGSRLAKFGTHGKEPSNGVTVDIRSNNDSKTIVEGPVAILKENIVKTAKTYDIVKITSTIFAFCPTDDMADSQKSRVSNVADCAASSVVFQRQVPKHIATSPLAVDSQNA